MMENAASNLLTLGILFAFFLLIFSKSRKQTIGETLRDIKEFVGGE